MSPKRMAGETATNRPQFGRAFWLCVGVALAVFAGALIFHRLSGSSEARGTAEAKLGPGPPPWPVTPGTLTKLTHPVLFKKVLCAPGPVSSEEACFWAPRAIILSDYIEANDHAMRLLVARFGAKPVEGDGFRPLACTRVKRYPARAATSLKGRGFLSCEGLAVLGSDLLSFKLITAVVNNPMLRGAGSDFPYVRLGTNIEVLDTGTFKSALNEQRKFKREEEERRHG